MKRLLVLLAVCQLVHELRFLMMCVEAPFARRRRPVIVAGIYAAIEQAAVELAG